MVKICQCGKVYPQKPATEDVFCLLVVVLFFLLIMKPFYPGSFGFGISQQAIAEALVINRGGFECLVSRFSTWRIRGLFFLAPLRPFMKHDLNTMFTGESNTKMHRIQEHTEYFFVDKGNCEHHEGENQYSTG